MYTSEGVGTPLYNLNQFFFFLFFTVVRIFLFPILSYRCLCVTLLTLRIPEVSTFRKICMIYCFVMSFLITLLQFYWYRLILRGLKKMFVGMGWLGASKSGQDDELDRYDDQAVTVDNNLDGMHHDGQPAEMEGG